MQRPKTEHNLNTIANAWGAILAALHDEYGLNTSDDNFTDTPKRIAKMILTERCVGINSETECMEILGKTFQCMSGSSNSNQMIIVANPVVTWSLCPHHFENVEYHVWAAYMPKERFVGISKFPRVIELFAKQPMLQESYTTGLANLLIKATDPLGVAIIVKGYHDCVVARGAKVNKDHCVVTSAVRGVFETEPTFKEEFQSLMCGY